MRRKFFLVLMLVSLAGICHGESWQQDRFVIGGWWAPRLTGDPAVDNARYEKMVEANFNLVLAVNHDFYSYRDSTDIGSRKSNLYALQRAAAMNQKFGANQLRMIVQDDMKFYIWGSDSPIPPWPAGEGDSWPKPADLDLTFYKTGLTADCRDALWGYLIKDEPLPQSAIPDLYWTDDTHTKRNGNISVTTAINMAAALKAQDPDKLPYIILLTYCDSLALFPNYFSPGLIDYHTYMSSVGLDNLISYDLYPFTVGTDSKLYLAYDWYHCLEVAAVEAKDHNKPFWCYADCTEWYDQNPDGSQVYPTKIGSVTQATLRFQAFCPLLYGAKGIFWFSYDTPCLNPDGCTGQTYFNYQKGCLDYNGEPNVSGDKPLYTWVKEINGVLKTAGPLLMNSQWLGAWHGTAKNNMGDANPNLEFDTDLPVVDQNTPILSKLECTANQSVPAVGILKDNSPTIYQYYLLVMNKDMDNSQSISFLTQKRWNIYELNLSDDSWNFVANTTSCQKDYLPGDIRVFGLKEAEPMVTAGRFHTVGLKSDGTVVAVGDNYYGQCNVDSWSVITQVAAASRVHTVGLKADGTVVAVGSNYYGQCNVSSWSGITQVAAGDYHTMGLKADGTVIAVGSNVYDQVSSWSGITQIAAGSGYCLGLKADGTVVAAGENNYGQCDVASWSGIKQITAGSYHTVGLKTDGTVIAVGYNADGQCNVGSWSGITLVAAGNAHTVGLKADGTAAAVGSNFYGQCSVSSWSGMTQIATGPNHTVGLKADGTVVADSMCQCDCYDWNLSVPENCQQHGVIINLSGGGVWSRPAAGQLWQQLINQDAIQIISGDVDGDGLDDLIGWWDVGIWVKYAKDGFWEKILDADGLKWLASGDMNGLGRDDIVGSWENIGVWMRSSEDGSWHKLHDTTANMVASGDFDGDQKADLLGAWDMGIWIRYADDTWEKVLNADGVKFLCAGDFNGDGQDDLLSSWTGIGTWLKYTGGAWEKILDLPADKLSAVDIDGNGYADLLGLWSSVPGLWLYRPSVARSWQKIEEGTGAPNWIATGKLK